MVPDNEYICGLWWLTMPDSLVWWSNGVRSNDVSDVAPSWSWLIVVSHVKLIIQSRAQHKVAVANLVGSIRTSRQLTHTEESPRTS